MSRYRGMCAHHNDQRVGQDKSWCVKDVVEHKRPGFVSACVLAWLHGLTIHKRHRTVPHCAVTTRPYLTIKVLCSNI